MTVTHFRSASACLFVLLCCVSLDAVSATAGGPERTVVQVAGHTISFAMPNLLPDRDFPPPAIGREIRAQDLVEPQTVIIGHWNASRPGWLKTSAMLNIWVDARRWPDGAASARGCRAKAKAAVEERIAKQSQVMGEAVTAKVEELVFAGRPAVKVQGLYATPKVRFAVPLDDDYYLNMVFSFAAGSEASTSDRLTVELNRFLNSLTIEDSGAGCGNDTPELAQSADGFVPQNE